MNLFDNTKNETQLTETEANVYSSISDDTQESSIVSWLVQAPSESLLDKGEEANIKAEDVDFQRVNIIGEEYSAASFDERVQISHSILKALCIRQKYMSLSYQAFNKTTDYYMNLLEKSKNAQELYKKIKDFDMKFQHIKTEPDDENIMKSDGEQEKEGWPLKFKMKKGVVEIEIAADTVVKLSTAYKKIITSIPHVKRSEFISDFKLIRNMTADGPIISFSYRRLSFINSKFQMHVLLNEDLEAKEQKNVPHRDFYNVRKVDNHIHAASSMNQKHLLRFIKKMVKTYPNMKVSLNKETNKELALAELFEILKISCYDLNVDNLSVHADNNTFHRFDKFNLKYNPVEAGELREVFLKTSNLCDGIFFAKIIKEVLQDLDESKYQYTEMRLSIYGKSFDEWDELAKWVLKYDVKSPQNIWIIQIPRLYNVYKNIGLITSFQDLLYNIFIPLFEVSSNPKSHPELHEFLKNVSAIDSVDDESKPEKGPMYKTIERPDKWTGNDNPSFDYYLYYLFVNLMKVNHLRNHRGLNVFKLRPHCGEAGSILHLISGFILSENINHGLLLRKSPVLQYLFYLCQIGISMSPLSNNSLFLNYHRNPLPNFLAKGLKVSISTDDPLQFHFTKEPLMEEYSIAAQVWKLSSTDMCELARNSILMSGFSDQLKQHWLGKNYQDEGVEGNDISLTNLPNVRIAYRQETLVGELLNLLMSIVRSESSIIIKRRRK